MPCSDGGPSAEQIFEQRAVPSVLCAVLTILEGDGTIADVLGRCDWREAGVTREWVALWWGNHKAMDAQRRKREHDEELREAKRLAVLGKLSGEEKSILGLR